MALHKPYLDVPGTTIFDAEQSRKGYWLNQLCMSLMQAENLTRFKADEDAYLATWPMMAEQKAAVRARDLNWMMRTVRRPTAMASASFRRSSFIRAMSAVSMAVSLPAAPIAIPTLATASAGASLTPSPIMPTWVYSFTNSRICSTF